MTRTPSVFSGILTVALLLPVMASAAGNVLLPPAPNGGQATSLPSLGLSPSWPASGTSVPDSAPSAQPTASMGSPTSASPVAPPQPTAVAPASVGEASSDTAEAKAAAAAVSAASTLQISGTGTDATNGVPTRIVHQQDLSSFMNQINASQPYSLTLALSERSVFGAQDVAMISNKLGIPRDQIPSACIVGPRGILQTDKGTYIVSGAPSPQVAVRYDGMIKSMLLAAQAFCVTSQLPGNSGFINESNGRYNVPLQAIDCPLPTRQASRLVITYGGDNPSSCSYE